MDNGVVVATEAMTGVSSVAASVWVRHGSAHEPARLSGVTHLLEHMAFRGTETRSGFEIAAELESLGGSLNAFTSRECTGYEARVLARHLPQAVDVLADLVRGPLLRDEDLEVEKRVVLEEIAAAEDEPDELVFDLHRDRMWGRHPYGKSVLGVPETVQAISRDDLAELRDRTATGANLVVAAAGRVDHDEFVALADLGFGGLDEGERTPPVAAPEPPRPFVDFVERDCAQLHIVLGRATPGLWHPDRYALGTLATALGGGMSSRLFQRVREDMGLAYSVSTSQGAHERAGMMGTYLGTSPEWGDVAVSAVLDTYADVAENGLTDEELARTRRQIEGRILLGAESPAARVYHLCEAAMADRPHLSVDEAIARFGAVEGADVARLAREVVDPRRQCTLCLGQTGALERNETCA